MLMYDETCCVVLMYELMCEFSPLCLIKLLLYSNNSSSSTNADIAAAGGENEPSSVFINLKETEQTVLEHLN